MLDQVYHSGQLEKSSTEILKEIQGKYYELPYIENTVCNFFCLVFIIIYYKS